MMVSANLNAKLYVSETGLVCTDLPRAEIWALLEKPLISIDEVISLIYTEALASLDAAENEPATWLRSHTQQGCSIEKLRGWQSTPATGRLLEMTFMLISVGGLAISIAATPAGR